MDIVSKFIQKNYQKYLENFNYLVISDWPDLKSQYYIRGIHKKTLQLDSGGILTRDLTIKSHKICFYDYNLKTGRYFNIDEYFIFYKPNKLPKINKIYLLGFDLYGINSFVNNFYKNTKNYSDDQSHAINPDYWIRQSLKIFKLNPDKEFVIINQPAWQIPDQWRLSNVRVELVEDFKTEFAI